MGTWFPAILSTGLLAAVLYIARKSIVDSISKTVQHSFDKKLTAFKADLSSKEAQVEALRSGALTGLASRQALLGRRRLEAVDQVWSSVISLVPLKGASASMSIIKFDATAEETAKNPEFRKMFEIIAKNYDVTKFPTAAADSQRPYLSPLAWALFSAYNAILFFAVAQLKILAIGVEDGGRFLNKDHADNLLNAALPHRAEYIAKFGRSGYHFLLDELENTLLAELKRLLAGAESDEESVKQSASILRATEQVNLDTELKAEIPASVRSEPPPAPE